MPFSKPFYDNSCNHTLADLKFVLIEQVATKTATKNF